MFIPPVPAPLVAPRNLAPAVETWGFGVNKQRRVPASEQVVAQRAKVDWRAMQLDTVHRTAAKGRPGLQADLGGIAKGYGVDVAARAGVHADGPGPSHQGGSAG